MTCKHWEERRILGQSFKCVRLRWWGRFVACFLPVLIKRITVADWGAWCRIHSPACVVALRWSLALRYWTLLCVASGFVSLVWKAEQISSASPGHPACSLCWRVTVTPRWWRRRLSQRRFSVWSTQSASLLISRSLIKQMCPQVGARETHCLDSAERRKKRIKSDICLVSDAPLIPVLYTLSELQIYCRDWRLSLLTQPNWCRFRGLIC